MKFNVLLRIEIENITRYDESWIYASTWASAAAKAQKRAERKGMRLVRVELSNYGD